MSQVTKESFLNECKQLSYEARISKAAKFGRDNKDSPVLLQLINNLREHPAPEVPQVPAEEGYSELLPPKKTNIVKYFNEDQLAITAAIASKTQTKHLLAETTSPSNFFKRVAVKAVVGQLNNDSELESQILSATPATRALYLHNLIKSRKTALLEKLIPVLQTQKGVESVVGVIHGCSTTFLKQHLTNPLFFNSRSLNWKKIAQFHGDAILDLMKSELEKSPKLKRETIYTEWFNRLKNNGDALADFYLKGHNTKKMWALFVSFPSTHYVGSGKSDIDEKDMKPSWIQPGFTQIILEYFGHFMNLCGADILKWITSTLVVNDDPQKGLMSALPRGLFEHCVPWPEFLNFITTIFKLSPPDAIFSGPLSTILWTSVLESATCKQVLEYASTLAKGLSPSKLPNLNSNVIRVLSSCLNRVSAIENEYKRKEVLKCRQKDGTLQSISYKAKSLAAFESANVELIKLLAPLVTSRWKFDNADEGITESYREVSSFYSQIVNSIQHMTPKILELVFDTFTPFLQLSKQPDDYFKGLWVTVWENTFASIGTSLIQKIALQLKQERLSADEKKSYEKVQGLVFDFLFNFWKREPLRQATRLTKLLSSLTNEQISKVYGSFKFEHLLELAVRAYGEENTDDLIVRELLPNLPVKLYQEALNNIMKSDKVSEQMRDLLQRYRDVTDHAVRKELTNATDSNSAAVRLKAIYSLASATLRAPQEERAVQMKRTLSFLRLKIKNEQITNRVAAIRSLFEYQELPAHKDRHPLIPEGTTAEIVQFWFDMLQDALEIQDLDKEVKTDADEVAGSKPVLFNCAWREPVTKDSVHQKHPLLKFFFALSQEAMLLGAAAFGQQNHPDALLFDFGVELQWRMDKFRLGEKDVAKKFRIHLHPSFFLANRPKSFREGCEAALVTSVLDAYQKRIGERNPKWQEDVQFWIPLYRAVAQKWHTVPQLKQFVDQSIVRLRASKKDANGLLIIDGDNNVMNLFNHLICLHKRNWWQFDSILVDYMENTLLKSRQAMHVVFQWFAGKQKKAKSKKEKFQARDDCVSKLLEITKSAIYIKFVWRHLVRWRPEKLNPFLNARQAFRGIFFEEPTARPENLPGKARKPKSSKKRGPKRNKRNRRVATGPRKNHFELPLLHVVSGVNQVIKEEIKKEKKLRKELLAKVGEDENALSNLPVTLDHEEFFCLPACYGLRRLLPSQIELLAQQWKNRLFNSERSMPSRVRSCIRWTLMPTITYNDIVAMWGENKSKKPEKGQKGGKKTGFPVNLEEALLKGVMCSDERTAPLNFLLSQEFLSSDRARIAAYALSAAIPHLKGSSLTDILKLVLSGDRQRNLKVTAYKEIIRILAKTPISKHIDMIQREWDRKEVHRDLRIELIKAASRILVKETAQSSKVAWNIFTETLKHQEDWKHISEILTALLGAFPADLEASFIYKLSEDMFQLPRIVSHHTALQKAKLPPAHCARFANEIVLPLCTTAIDDDVKTIAIFSMANFRFYGVSEKTCDILYQLMADKENNLLNSKKPAEQHTFDARWRNAATLLVELTGTSKEFKKKEFMASKSWVVKTIETMLASIASLKVDQRSKRVHLVDNLKFLAGLLPSRGPFNGLFTWEQEQSFVQPFRKAGEVWWEYLMTRAVEQFTISAKPANGSPTIENAQAVLHELFTYGSTHPTFSSKVLSLATTLLKNISSYAYPKSEMATYVAPLYPKFFSFSLAKDAVCNTDAYKVLLMQTGLKIMGSSGYYLHMLATSPDLVVQFIDACFNMATSKDYFYKICAKDMPKAISTLITYTDTNTDYYSPPTYSLPASQLLLNHFVNKFTEENYEKPTLTYTLLKEIILELINCSPFLFASAKKASLALDKLIIYYGLENHSEIKKLSALFVKLLEGLEENDKVNYRKYRAKTAQVQSVVQLITSLLEMNLAAADPIVVVASTSTTATTTTTTTTTTPTTKTTTTSKSPKSEGYVRVTFAIAVKALTRYPRFVLWQPDVFKSFFYHVIALQQKEANLMVVPKPNCVVHVIEWITFILKKGYYEQLQMNDKPAEDEKIYSGAAKIIKEFSAHQNSVVRYIGLQFLELIGIVSQVKVSDTTANWRPEFVELLNIFSSDQEAFIYSVAQRIVTTEPVSFTESSLNLSSTSGYTTDDTGAY